MTSPTGTSRGFTLIEAVLVSLILVILVLATVPNFHRTARRLRLERSVFELAQLLRSAHARAVADGSEHTAVWERESRRLRLEHLTDDGVPARVQGTAGASAPLMEGALLEVTLTKEGSRVPCGCVRFFPDGTSEAVTVTVQLDDRSYRMIIDGTTSQVKVAAGLSAR